MNIRSVLVRIESKVVRGGGAEVSVPLEEPTLQFAEALSIIATRRIQHKIAHAACAEASRMQNKAARPD